MLTVWDLQMDNCDGGGMLSRGCEPGRLEQPGDPS